MITYRLIVIEDNGTIPNGMYTYGKTAITPELAKAVPGNLSRRVINGETLRVGVERSDWNEGDKSPYRTVLVEMEKTPGEWKI